ncbi:uncharacterized protein LOC111704278, partial [Eurytemora carolleeae]|uniref:uncharacterized protein LOC111704278 n=1 Tax=Eurytemora carolleeae TaxID=1294199 RepID=UPI000C75E7F4
MVDLGGYVIILVETKDKRVKLYGSPADKAELEVADEILEINGKSLNNSSHSQVITHIHNCIKSRTICLRVKRRTGSKLAEELAESSNVQDAFVIAVEQQARERLEKLSALRKIKPVDMTVLSQELCDDKRGERETPVYSTPLSRIGSNHNVRAVVENETGRERNLSGAEELELNQRLNRSRDPSAEMDSSRDINSRTSDRSRDLSRTSSRSKDLSRTSSRSRDHSKDIARSRDSSRDSLVSGESGISRESLRSRDNKPGLGLRSRNPSKETVISKDSCIDRLSSRSQTLDRSRNGSRKCQGIGAGSTGSICSNYQDTTRITPGSHQTLDSSVSRRNSERLGERIKNSVDIRSSQDPLLTEGTRRNSRYNETNQPLGDIHSSLARSVDTKLGCEPNPILLNSSPIKTIETKSSLQNKLTPPEEFNSIEPGAERSLEPDLTEQKSESFPLKFINDSEASSCHNLKEVLIGGDTEGNRSARGSVRQRHEVKTFSE